jgi:hypothetical protein
MASFPNICIISNLRRAMFHNLAWNRVDAASCYCVQYHRVNAGSLYSSIARMDDSPKPGGTKRQRLLSTANRRGLLSYRFLGRGLMECVKDSLLSYSVDIFCWGKSLLPHRSMLSKLPRHRLFHLISFGYRARSAVAQKCRLWPLRCRHSQPDRSREQLLFRSRVLRRTGTKLGSGGS